MLCDLKNRRAEYLRLSVTDLCNLRCQYCMPLEGGPHFGKEKILSFEEITRLIGILSGLGIRRVRLTGGEPLVRKSLPILVEQICSVPGIEEVVLTTNGLLLKDQVQNLKAAGLARINVHLDTLSPEKFHHITRWGKIEQVFEGIKAAIDAGFDFIKLNMVLQKGINDDEVPNMLRFAASQGMVLRVIELMPIGEALTQEDHFISVSQVREKLKQEFTLLPSLSKWGHGPAVYQHVSELKTDIGFISPISSPFCDTCNRIRISSDGRLQDCLAYDGDVSLRDCLRNSRMSDDEISAIIRRRIHFKVEGHGGFLQKEGERTPCMYGIGG
ncbi:MAG: cyclic pyranopterin phosphate synthase MoaA [Deltaproteobacteria bacterium RIFCSPLOWO2_12_FULL_40_28]|nr:MAG: cyclic pyranopterin phosphate synthase MoaA [Deltaproteobacteria bacterium RIFCSPHIGHO2_02_FULL_40_28]OGQ19436.1 MAG: cyclic pyranopterin phosphate synthase MoaA [Deltaproteobacteria bacterium RIFCSPHIGHO2_12_FULL_40_32]OGQ39880.1 MAG: cyclic pyranopterin phosphate synthase MoaA [Deltaproteobacteria bacterium RIFCSPLOWO2_02_FULL_40_36]OGQ53874.1 MAG: cyclic pyranopterin phosphate synthase MoaA [Deltaproteobacteria bacterium RIFCSPLOWO2_12_FULL_40_28]